MMNHRTSKLRKQPIRPWKMALAARQNLMAVMTPGLILIVKSGILYLCPQKESTMLITSPRFMPGWPRAAAQRPNA